MTEAVIARFPHRDTEAMAQSCPVPPPALSQSASILQDRQDWPSPRLALGFLRGSCRHSKIRHFVSPGSQGLVPHRSSWHQTQLPEHSVENWLVTQDAVELVTQLGQERCLLSVSETQVGQPWCEAGASPDREAVAAPWQQDWLLCSWLVLSWTDMQPNRDVTR